MQSNKLKILLTDLLELYISDFPDSAKQNFENLHDSNISIESFSFYTSVSAVFSSKIEGEEMDLDSYIKHKRFGVKYQPDYTRKIDDLYGAYQFAQKSSINDKSLLEAHGYITKHILNTQGKFRTGNMYVLTKSGNIEYVAVAPDQVKTEMAKFHADLKTLLDAELTFEESFFFASMIHLVFVKIHPFEDGNGRMGRLLEKWFLAQKLGDKAWFVQSERYYYEQHQTYYANIRKLGLEYDELDYRMALPFLKMLVGSLTPY